MAITGTFVADFAQFYDAVTKADVRLRTLSEGAAGVEKSLNRMVDNFSGRKIISDATLAAEAVERIGGVSKLTEAELARVTATATEAAAKLRALGQDVPATIERLATARGKNTEATNQAAAANSTWAKSLGQVDSILSQVGINVGGQARALGELGGVAGQSASSLGVLGTAGLVVGAAVAGWQIGRAVADFFKLDEIIGNATAALLGFGDVAAEAAGAKADVLAKASNAAGIEIKDLSLAMAINEEVAKNQAAAVTANAVAQQNAADVEQAAADQIHRNNERMLKDLQTQMDANKAARDLEAKELLQNTKLWDEYYALQVAHGGTANAIARAQIEQWARDAEAAAVKAGTATDGFYAALEANSREKLAAVGVNWDLWKTSSIKALQEVADNELRTLNEMIKSGEFRREEIDKQRAKYEEAREAARGYGKEAVAAQEAGAAAAAKHTKELEAQIAAAAALAAANRAMGSTTQYDMSTAEGRAQVDPKIAVWLHDGYSLAQASAIAFALAWGIGINPNDPLFAQKGPRVPGFAGGVQNFGGGLALVGERGPELVALPGGADVIPIDRGSGGGGGVTIHNTFHIVDTEANIARRVSDHLMRQIVIGRKLGFA